MTLPLFDSAPPDAGDGPQAPERRPTLYLVDGPNIAFRAHYAIRGLTNSRGEATGALFGYCLQLFKLLKDWKPDYLCLCWDPRGGTFRNRMYADYKGTRPDMPEDLRRQLDIFPRVADALGLCHVVLDDYEADDVIGTLATRHKETCDVTIVTGDKDMMQLVDDERVTILDTMKDQRIGPREVVDKWGVPPERIVDILALMGDSSDNIPGVRGIGQKGAAQLIQDFGGVEEVFARLDEVKGRNRKPLEAEDALESARLSHRLAVIDTNAPVELTLDQLRYAFPPTDKAAVRAIFQELEFQRFLAELGGDMKVVEAEGTRLVRTESDLDELLAVVGAAEQVAVHLVTEPPDDGFGEPIGLSVSTEEGAPFYVPIGHRGPDAGAQLPATEVLAGLGETLVRHDRPLLAHSIKPVLRQLGRAGVDPVPVGGDTEIAGFLLNPGRRTHDLEGHTLTLLGHKLARAEELVDKGEAVRGLADVAPGRAADWVAERAVATRSLHARMAEGLREQELDYVYQELELPLTPILARMENLGIRVDVPALEAHSEALAAGIAEAERRVYEAAGEEFNVGSPKQLATILFDKLGLPVVKKTKTGPSTDHAVLEELALQHDLPAAIIRWRSLAKLKSTYVDALPPLVRPETGRLHTTFHQTVAATGRLSSSNPNLQNIPIRTPEGRRIRECFVAEPGYRLVSADYSQVELRVLTTLVGGRGGFYEAFAAGKDIHRVTAAQVFEVQEPFVTDEMRRVAKAINFGLVYGQGAFGLSKVLQIPRKDAATYIRRYKKQYPEVDRYTKEIVDFAREHRYVKTLLGRRRPITDLTSQNYNQREAAKRVAINTPVQGSAADIIKLAMLRVDRMLREDFPDVRLLLQVHDELVFEVPEGRVEALKPRVVEAMSGAFELAVPLRVDIGVGTNWEQAH